MVLVDGSSLVMIVVMDCWLNFQFRYMDYVFGNETEARTFSKVHGWEVIFMRFFWALKSKNWTKALPQFAKLRSIFWLDWQCGGDRHKDFSVAKGIWNAQEDHCYHSRCRSCCGCWRWESKTIPCYFVTQGEVGRHQWGRYTVLLCSSLIR